MCVCVRVCVTGMLVLGQGCLHLMWGMAGQPKVEAAIVCKKKNKKTILQALLPLCRNLDVACAIYACTMHMQFVSKFSKASVSLVF